MNILFVIAFIKYVLDDFHIMGNYDRMWEFVHSKTAITVNSMENEIH